MTPPSHAATGTAFPAAATVSPPPYVPGITRDRTMPAIRRTHRSALAVWWREIDGVLLFLVAMLMAAGTLAVAAAAPASARQRSAASAQAAPVSGLLRPSTIIYRWPHMCCSAG